MFSAAQYMCKEILFSFFHQQKEAGVRARVRGGGGINEEKHGDLAEPPRHNPTLF